MRITLALVMYSYDDAWALQCLIWFPFLGNGNGQKRLQPRVAVKHELNSTCCATLHEVHKVCSMCGPRRSTGGVFNLWGLLEMGYLYEIWVRVINSNVMKLTKERRLRESYINFLICKALSILILEYSQQQFKVVKVYLGVDFSNWLLIMKIHLFS